MDAGQHPVHPGFGQDDGLDDAANLLVGDTAGNGTAPVYAVTSAAGTFMFAVVLVVIVNRFLLRPAYSDLGFAQEELGTEE